MLNQIIIVAGGSGLRMGSDIPKQFLEIGSLPVLMHTINAFYAFDNNALIILVLPENQQIYWFELCETHEFNVPIMVVSGGDTRFESVKNGLVYTSNEGLIAVHDGVRPFVSKQTLQSCFQTAAEKGNAIPVISPVESIREVVNGESKVVDRSNYRLIQTPQVFNAKAFKLSYNVDYVPTFTDDATVFETSGHAINLIDGNRENIKITTAVDLVLGEYFLAHMSEA